MATKLEQAIAAWPLIAALAVGLVFMGEMRGAVARDSATLTQVSLDLATVKMKVAKIEGMLFDRTAEQNATSVAVPAEFTPGGNGTPCDSQQ